MTEDNKAARSRIRGLVRRRPKTLGCHERWGLPDSTSSRPLPERPLQLALSILRASAETKAEITIEIKVAVGFIEGAHARRTTGKSLRDAFVKNRLTELHWAAEDLRDLLWSLDDQAHRYLDDQQAFDGFEELRNQLRGIADPHLAEGFQAKSFKSTLLRFLDQLSTAAKKAAQVIEPDKERNEPTTRLRRAGIRSRLVGVGPLQQGLKGT